ncbi:MAG: hypothetical protein K8T89_08785 [Planctomycetes bacterium]|nr:hypothetical protein [Planctomycetota bacterium]
MSDTISLSEQILALVGGEPDKKSLEDLTRCLSGEPKPAAIKKAIKELVATGKLHAHGKGKSLAYAKFPEPIPVPLAEQILPLIGDKPEKKSVADLTPSLTGAPKPAAINKALKELTEAGRLFVHGTGKSLTYARYPEPIPVPLAEQILSLFAETDKKSVTDLASTLAGSPKPAAINKALKELTAAGTLHVHGKGKALTYAKFPEPKLAWYETAPHGKAFAALLTGARKLVDVGAANVEELLRALQEKLGQTSDARRTTIVEIPPAPSVSEPLVVEPPPPPVSDLRTTIHEAYDYLCKFVEFRDKIVEIRRLYYEVLERMPGLTVPAFHAELEALNREWQIELRQLNEVEQAKDRHLAIERDDRLYYYIRWK